MERLCMITQGKKNRFSKFGWLAMFNREDSNSYTYHIRARSQIPVVGLTGSAPGWPSALKLPGAAV